MTAPLSDGFPGQRGASRVVAGVTGKSIRLESHSRMFAQQGWRKGAECFGEGEGDERALVMHRRCVLQMDGTDTEFRPKVQCFGST